MKRAGLSQSGIYSAISDKLQSRILQSVFIGIADALTGLNKTSDKSLKIVRTQGQTEDMYMDAE